MKYKIYENLNYFLSLLLNYFHLLTGFSLNFYVYCPKGKVINIAISNISITINTQLFQICLNLVKLNDCIDFHPKPAKLKIFDL